MRNSSVYTSPSRDFANCKPCVSTDAISLNSFISRGRTHCAYLSQEPSIRTCHRDTLPLPSRLIDQPDPSLDAGSVDS